VRVLPIQIEHRWQDIAAITPPLPCADYLAVTTRSLFLVTATTVTSYRRGRGLVIRSRREAVELSPSGPRLVGIRVAKGLGGYPPVRRSSMLLAPPRRRLPSSGVLVCRRHFRVFRRVADTSPPRADGNHPNPCLPLRARPLLVAEGDKNKSRPWVSESLPTAQEPTSTGYRDLVLLPDVPRKLPRSRCFRDGYGACSEAPPPRR